MYSSRRAADLRLEALEALDVIATHPAGMESLVRAGTLEAVAASSAFSLMVLKLLLNKWAYLLQCH